MRIGIDAFPVVHNYGGVARYTRNLLRALLAVESDDEFVAYVPMESPGCRELEVWEASSRLKRVQVRRAFFRWRGWLDKLDLYHGTNYKVQTMGRLGGIVTIHDLWLDRHPEYSKKVLGQRMSFFRTRQRASQAVRVITVSEHSAKDIQELYGLSKDRIAVIPNGVSGEFRPDHEVTRVSRLRLQYGLSEEPYILFMGGADPRKNHISLFRAYALKPALRESHFLVAVGNPVHRLGSIMETARTLGISDRVVCTGMINTDDLRLLYSNAALFVFPSRYEGFGLPVLEAMACGTPVITSNTTALPEVAGDAAILINPEDPEDLAEAMVKILSDRGLRETLRNSGIERARQFTWARTAQETVKLYREICSSEG
jgi:glycosyltransferase involved in cell wall biosynthesis